VALHEQHQDRPTQARNAPGKRSRLSITMTPLTQKSKKAKCMPSDTTIAHTRQPSTQTMCHRQLRNQMNTFLKHEEKGIHDPPRRSHGYLEPRRGIDFFRRIASCCHPADCTLSPWQHTIMVQSKASGYATERQIPARRRAATSSHKGRATFA